MLSAKDLSSLAAHGGGFALKAPKFHQDELVRIAAAGAGKCQLVIRDSRHLSLEDMIRRGRAAEPCLLRRALVAALRE
jgi:hypothetical protein